MARGSTVRVSEFTISTASSVAQARSVLRSATPPNQSFTQLGNFSDEKIDRALKLKFRRPAWVWFAARQDGAVLGAVAGWGAAARRPPTSSTFLDLPGKTPKSRTRCSNALSRTQANRGRRSVETIHFLPSESRLRTITALGELVETLAASRFRMLGATPSTGCPFVGRRSHNPGHRPHFRGRSKARRTIRGFARVLREILVGSLDAHDVVAIAKGDLETVAAGDDKEFLERRPVRNHFSSPSTRRRRRRARRRGPCGVRPRSVSRRSSVFLIFTAARGYAAQLLGWITKESSATTPSSSSAKRMMTTSHGGAFAKVGYPHTESRIDFLREIVAACGGSLGSASCRAAG